MLENMAKHVKNQLNLSFDAIIEKDKEKAEEALELDFTTNNLFEKVRFSVETVVTLDHNSKFSKIILFNEAAYNYERIGDYCAHLNKFVINDKNQIDNKIINILKKMHNYAQKSISISTNAFIKGDVFLKGDLIDIEEKMHIKQEEAMKEIALQMAESYIDDINQSNYYIYLTRVIKGFERIGDISVEIMDLAIEFHKDIPRPTVPRTFRE